MILDAIVNQINQRFQHEKRAQVCLWFDERQEFARVLDALDAHLGSMIHVPFRLLRYNTEETHGQIWIKHQILRAVESDPVKTLRFVVYLPMAEDRIDHPGPNGEPSLVLLTEYRIGGISWRINGKRSTLCGLLRQAGVALPEGAGDQRRLYDGSRDSLLAKYIGKFVDRPAVFWTETLTPVLAQSRLLGDQDQTL